jgi:hypothetical protein
MHIIENIIPALVNLWTGDYKGLDAGTGDYHIHENVWKAIGVACAVSGSTIPSSFGCQVPNIMTEHHHFIAESWFLFALFLGPVLLCPYFAQPEYYVHFVEFVKLVMIINKFLTAINLYCFHFPTMCLRVGEIIHDEFVRI